MSLTDKLTATGKHLYLQGRTDHAEVTVDARYKLIEQQRQLAKQQEEIAEYRNFLIMLSENSSFETYFPSEEEVLSNLLDKHNKGE